MRNPPIDGELIKGVEHAFQSKGSGPWIRAITLQYEHPMVHGGAFKRAYSVLKRMWLISVWCGTEDDVPRVRDVVDLRGPEVRSIRSAAIRIWIEDDPSLCLFPISRQRLRAPQGDVVVGRVGQEIPVTVGS